MVETKYPKGTPIECYRKILKIIVSLNSSIDPNVIDTQFNVVNILIDRFDKMYSGTIEVEKIKGFLEVSRDLKYKQIKEEYNERH